MGKWKCKRGKVRESIIKSWEINKKKRFKKRERENVKNGWMMSLNRSVIIIFFVRIGRDGLTKLSIEKVWFDLDVREMLLCNSPLHQQPGDRKNKWAHSV